MKVDLLLSLLVLVPLWVGAALEDNSERGRKNGLRHLRGVNRRKKLPGGGEKGGKRHNPYVHTDRHELPANRRPPTDNAGGGEKGERHPYVHTNRHELPPSRRPPMSRRKLGTPLPDPPSYPKVIHHKHHHKYLTLSFSNKFSLLFVSCSVAAFGKTDFFI